MSTSTTKTSRPTWLITGTSNGLGLSLSQHILLKGHNLISLSRHANPHVSLTAHHQAHKEPVSTFHHIQHDLSDPDPDTIKSAISTFLQSHPNLSVDILVNNAGMTLFDAVENTSSTTLNTVMTTNFFSPVYLTQSLLPQMRASNAQKANNYPKIIVNISSTQGLCTDPSELAYDASKHALEAMSGVLASEVSNFGIRVMVVELGSLRTGFASSGEARREKSSSSSTPQNEQQRKISQGDEQGSSDPYVDPSHPVATRKSNVARLASEPGLARGDPTKTAAILFDAMMKTEGSVVNDVLERQRKRTVEDGGNVKVERLVLGSDAQPKIEKSVQRVWFDVESCRGVSGLIEADEGAK